MSYYRNLANDVGATTSSLEQNEANEASGGSQSLPASRVDGYDEKFDPPLLPDYECPICELCLRDAVQTRCGHRFCRSCIERHMRTNCSRCPIDSQELKPQDLFSDNLAKREINQFTVKCRTVKNDKNCQWKGEFQKLEDHLAICEFVDVSCPKGCGQAVERKAMENHVKKECPKRTVSCQHCKTNVQYRNSKDHLAKCQKVNISCPQCTKKMLREKLVTHGKKCPKAQALCEFKSYGCKWTGLRSNLPSHMQNDIAAHLSLIVHAISVLLPNARDKSKGAGSSKLATSSAPLEELSRRVDKNDENVNQLKEKIEQMERKYREMVTRSERQQAERETATMALRNSIAELEARTCNGIYLWRITGYPTHFENARQGTATAVHSPPFYTAFYGYKLCLRVYPNGVDTGYDSHASLFVHMMQSDWDDTLEWPFSGRI